MHLLGINDLKKLLKEINIQNYKIIRNNFLLFTLDFIISVLLALSRHDNSPRWKCISLLWK